MPQITKYRRFKRGTVLIRRTQCLQKYPRNKGCMPSYEKLRSNNSCLARALSKQKEKGRLLFNQNIALLAEIQDLNVACNKRDNTIVNVLQNAKEMLTMLVTMTKCVTSTISSCQEFASSSNTSLRVSCNSHLRGENRRLSARSPARGIVKPMISGHTITKPTINLSRINLRHFNNSSNLSTIEEVSATVTPVENLNVNNDSSPTTVPARQARNTTGRTCRMPERLNTSSPTINEVDEQRFSKRKSRHSVKNSRSQSNRLSTSNKERRSAERTELIGSPLVKLNDVSKLLHNCQTINIRRLGSVQDDLVNESLEINEAINNTQDKNDNNISETQLLMDFTGKSNNLEETNDSVISNNEFIHNSKKSFTREELGVNIQTNNRNSHDNVSNWDDPLEGSSWMFKNSQKQSSLTNICTEADNVKGSNKNNSIHQSIAKTSTSYKMQTNKENLQYISSSSEDESCVQNEQESDSSYSKKSTVKVCTSEKEDTINNFEENYNKIEEDCTTAFQGFVTRQRGHSSEDIDDDFDDFTLMYRQRPINNVPFDINDLQLPVLEDSILKSVIRKEPEPEITTTMQKITQNCLTATTSNDIKDESLLDNSMVKLPLLSNTTIDCTIPVVDISLNTQQLKQLRKTSKTGKTDNSSSTTSSEKKNGTQKKKSKNDKDPSAATVVLQKLNGVHVKQQTPPLVETSLHDSSSLTKKIFNYSSLENSSDSECSVTSINLNAENAALKRPRRKKAPQNMKEHNLKKKLRRCE